MSTGDTQKIRNDFKGKDVVSLHQFDRSSIETLFKTTAGIRTKVEQKVKLTTLGNILVALLFYEPSSRTFSSFVAAVKRLGGRTIEYQNPLQTSSAVKGETLEDTMRVMENYADIIIMRHFEIGAAQRAAFFVDIPVINAGDGAGEHPTQALMDMYTLHSQFGSLDNLSGVIAGDLLYGRTVHSLIQGLSYFKNVTLYLLSPQILRLQKDLVSQYKNSGIKLVEISDESEIPKNAHFWYWTRVQKERFTNLKDYEKVKNKFTVTPELLKERGNKDMIIMHPLPRVGEIDPAVDSDPRAVYLTKQLKSGVYVRMALLSLICKGN